MTNAEKEIEQLGSKKAFVKKWLKTANVKIASEFTKETGVEINPAYFYKIKSDYKEKPVKKKKKPANGANGKTAPKKPTANPPSKNIVVKALEEEVAYLRWWNLGERNGWVDRLLKDT